jgi:hypothetical protein
MLISSLDTHLTITIIVFILHVLSRYCGVIDEKKSIVEEVSNETCLEIVHDLATSLLKVGRGIQSDYTDGEVELGRYGEHLPGKTLVVSLASSPLFFTTKVP